MTKYEIEPYAISDLQSVLQLLQQNLSDAGVTRKTTAFWTWKHVDNPSGHSCVFVARASGGDQVIGLRAMMRVLVRSPDGALLHAMRPVDTATHKDWQKQGIFSRLTRHALQDIAKTDVHTVFNTPNQNSLPGYLKLGWKADIVQQIRAKPAAVPALLRSLLPLSTQAPRRWRKGEYDHALAALTDLSEEQLEELLAFCAWCDARRSQAGLRVLRNAHTLRWRYREIPTAEYRVLSIRHRGALVAALLYREHVKYGLTGALICDVFHDPDSSGALRDILSTARKRLSVAFLVASFAEETPEHRMLLSMGYRVIRAVTVASRALDRPDQAESPQPETVRWDLSLADIEIF